MHDPRAGGEGQICWASPLGFRTAAVAFCRLPSPPFLGLFQRWHWCLRPPTEVPLLPANVLSAVLSFFAQKTGSTVIGCAACAPHQRGKRPCAAADSRSPACSSQSLRSSRCGPLSLLSPPPSFPPLTVCIALRPATSFTFRPDRLLSGCAQLVLAPSHRLSDSLCPSRRIRPCLYHCPPSRIGCSRSTRLLRQPSTTTTLTHNDPSPQGHPPLSDFDAFRPSLCSFVVDPTVLCVACPLASAPVLQVGW